MHRLETVRLELSELEAMRLCDFDEEEGDREVLMTTTGILGAKIICILYNTLNYLLYVILYI
jgi:hypothetical protein